MSLVLRSCSLAVLRSCSRFRPVPCALRFSSCGMRLAACGVLPMTLRLVSFFTIKIREFLKAEGYYRSRKPHGKRLAGLARLARSRGAGLRRFTPQPARPVTVPRALCPVLCAPCPVPCAPCPVPRAPYPVSCAYIAELFSTKSFHEMIFIFSIVVVSFPSQITAFFISLSRFFSGNRIRFLK